MRNTRNNKSFISTILIMFLLFLAVFGSAGCGGGHSSNFAENTPIYEPDPEPTPTPEPTPDSSFTVIFDSNGGSYVDKQIVEPGKTATNPGDPVKDNNVFMGWYQAEGFSFRFDFKTPINENKTLFAKWYDINDKTDTDGDGLVDSLEFTFGTDLNVRDTDDDGLTDYEELNWLNYNPLVQDTDGNGILDGNEDPDKDGLINIMEASYGTNFIISDTDHDNLNDYEEIMTYKTDPLNPDTDGDNVNDGLEIALGTDPLKAESSFQTTMKTSRISDGDEEAVDISVTIKSSSEGAGTLSVNQADIEDNPLISTNMPGYLAAYEISADQFDSATITFTIGKEVGTISGDFQPTIYYLNEETGVFEEVEGQTINGNKIIASVSHFSIYVLLNKVEFEEVWNRDIKPPLSGENNVNKDPTLDIVFVIDASGSMSGNDPQRLALGLSKNFVEKLRDGKDKAAVVEFTSSAYLRQGLTTDKNLLNNAIDGISYYGGTYIYSGLSLALSILNASDSEYKYIILLTDGDDGYSYSYYQSFIQGVIEKKIVIYTIGMGDAVEDVLKSIASDTNGKYYRATASGSTDDIDLTDVFTDIEAETIDLTKDDNNDGIPDYYAQLMNDGVIRLENKIAYFTGVLDMYGDSADWDRDGLKNGDEIIIKTLKKGDETEVYVEMKSNPLFYDSDFDGVSDYQEVVEMKSDPFKTTIAGANATVTGSFASSGFRATDVSKIYLNESFEKIRDDNSFFDVYGYMFFSVLHNPSDIFPWNGNSIMDSDYVFDIHKDEKVMELLVNFFNDYTTQENLEERNKKLQFALAFKRAADVVEIASSLIGTWRSIETCAETIGTMGYSDSSIKGDVTKAENARIAAQASKNELTADKKDLLEVLNDKSKQFDEKIRISKILEKTIKTENDIKKFGNSTSDTVKNIGAIADFVSNWKDIDFDAILGATNKTLKTASSIATLGTLSAKGVQKMFGGWKNIASWKIKFFRDKGMRSQVIDKKTLAGKEFALTVTLVIDTLNTVADALNVVATYGTIYANYSELQKYFEILDYMEHSPLFPGHVRDGAGKLTVLMKDAYSSDPDWLNFISEAANLMGSKITQNAFKMAVDTLLVFGPTPVKLVIASFKLWEFFASILGISTRADTLIAAQTYYGLTRSSMVMADLLGSFENGHFNLFDATTGEEFQKYAVQLAQGRIVGLNVIMNYLSDGSAASYSDRGGLLNKQKTPEEIEEEYKHAISEVYKVIKNWNLKVSDQLPFFGTYGKN